MSVEPSWYASAFAYFQPVLSYLVPPFLAAGLSGYAVQRWKGRGDYIEKRLDEFCDIVAKTADVASEYWRVDQIHPDAQLNEVKLRSGLARIAGLRVLLEGELSGTSTKELRAAEVAFLRQTTGGEFGVHNRTADLTRFAGSQFSAANFVVAARQARMRDLRGFRQRR